MSSRWRMFLAMFRLSNRAVCEQSVGRDEYSDYHDYPDSKEHQDDNYGAVHFYRYTCKRCGKGFYI
jgi:hypothetical protein